MAKERVLIVDDEPAVRKVLTRVVERIGLEAETAASGEEALALLSYGKTFDLVLLDVMLGGMDGFAVVQQLREKKNDIPIMILSARSEEDNTLYGLELGADDYIAKPFNPVVLGAKIKALIRRNKAVQQNSQAQVAGPFVYHSDTMRLEKNGVEIPLSSKENIMMKLFLDHPGEVFTKEQLYRHVWGDVIVDGNAVMVYISHLRAKIEENPKNPCFLRTVWGMGYQFNPDGTEEPFSP